MSEPTWTDERLRRAFQTPGNRHQAPGEVPAPELLWDGVNGELSAAQTARLVAETALDSDRAEEWRLAKNLQAAVLKPSPATVVPMRPRLLSPRIWFSAAAVFLIAAAGLWLARMDQTPEPPTYRNSDTAEFPIRSLLPPDGRLSRARPLLAWEAAHPEEVSTYRITLSTEGLETLLSEQVVDDSSFLIPEELIRDLPAGATLLWRVSAVTGDGTLWSSPTFISRLE